MLNDRRPRVMVFGSKWLGAGVALDLHRLGVEVAIVSPSTSDRAFVAARDEGIFVVAKPDTVPLAPPDFPWRPDLCLCAGSFRIIPQRVIDWSRVGAMGYHPSLLPAFKGRHAIRDALASGLSTTGGTVFWLTGMVDCGPPVVAGGKRLQRAVRIIPGETPLGLWTRALGPLGREMLIEGVKAVFQVREGGV